MEADSYLKYKLLNIEFIPDLTKKIDDLYLDVKTHLESVIGEK